MFQSRFRPMVLLGIVAVFFGFYAVWWAAQMRAFKADVAALVAAKSSFSLQAKSFEYGGFPYRLELTAKTVRLSRVRADYSLEITSPQLVLIRQPWQRDFYLGAFTRPQLSASAEVSPSFPPLVATADGGQFSLRLSARGVRRLSVTFEKFSGSLPWSAKKVQANHLEFHGREFVAHDPLPVWKPTDPTPPAIFEVYMRGEDVMLDRGPFQLSGRAEITGDPKYPHGAPSLDSWARSGGTLEVRGFNLDRGTLSDTFLRGTFALDTQKRVIGGATVDTGCASWLYQVVDQPVPAGTHKCGNILRHHKLQVRKQGVEITTGE